LDTHTLLPKELALLNALMVHTWIQHHSRASNAKVIAILVARALIV